MISSFMYNSVGVFLSRCYELEKKEILHSFKYKTMHLLRVPTGRVST